MEAVVTTQRPTGPDRSRFYTWKKTSVTNSPDGSASPLPALRDGIAQWPGIDAATQRCRVPKPTLGMKVAAAMVPGPAIMPPSPLNAAMPSSGIATHVPTMLCATLRGVGQGSSRRASTTAGVMASMQKAAFGTQLDTLKPLLDRL